MTRPSDRLHQLVPGIYRSRDAVLSGRPMERFLGLLGSELDALRDAIRALADDHFVERASADALILLADLYGARLLDRDARVNRGVIARCIAWRRRRGTLPVLEEVVGVTTGWSAEVDESFRSLLHTQDLKNLVPWRGRTAIVWDPIATADPLTRNAPSVGLPRPDADIPVVVVGRDKSETVADALRRMGRADAGHHAASPRFLDLLGWARPDMAIIRTTRLFPIELEAVEAGPRVRVPTPDPARELFGFHLDPLGRDVPLVWLQPLERPDTIATLTELHEPDSDPGQDSGSGLDSGPRGNARTAAALLTPTRLAADGDLAEAQGALEIHIDGIQLVGRKPIAEPRSALVFAPLGPRPVLRFADTLRPGPGDEWAIKLIARQAAGDIVMAAAKATHGATSAVIVDERARTELAAATMLVRLRRLAGTGALRDASATWSALGQGTRLGRPLGPVVAINENGAQVLLRPELHQAEKTLRLARLPVAAPVWEALALSGDVPAPEPGCVLVNAGASLLLLIPERDAGAQLQGMGLYRVAISANTATVTRLVPGTALGPPARRDTAVAIHEGRLYVHGGAVGGAPIGDLWSISVAGAIAGTDTAWTPHPVRNPQPRRGASLLSAPAGLVLVGGEEQSGMLSPGVWLLDPTRTRLRWTALPHLPFAPSKPGILFARHNGAAIEALVWANRTRPRRHVLADGAAAWQVGAVEHGAPNPPAPGEGAFVDDAFAIAGPPPLPMSELILSMAGKSMLAFVPALDLTVAAQDNGETELDDEAQNPGLPDQSHATFHVASDGSTWLTDNSDLPVHTRHGGALHASVASRLADAPRIGVPERLSRDFFVLRQRNLGPWDKPFVLDHSDVVGLDPRLGRVLLPGNVPMVQSAQQAEQSRIQVSYRVGRGSAIGAGAMPHDRRPLAYWHQADDAPPTPPDLRDTSGPRRARVTAWVDPARAGQTLPSHGTAVAIVDDLAAAVRQSPEQPVLGLPGSVQVAPARLSAGTDGGLSIVATDTGSTPFVHADPGAGFSLAVHPNLGGDRTTDIWLAGLWLAGRLDLAMARGSVDVRWCTVGTPDAVAVRVPGGGHQSVLTRRTLPRVELEIRLYGCILGPVQVPPWVRLIAAGCTFDAGSREVPAIRAAGARVDLRHSTVHGIVQAGELCATSCAFAGAVHTDRPDLGWIRHSLLPAGGRAPRQYRSVLGRVALASIEPTHPGYLVLADNNTRAALSAGELGRLPGAHADRQSRLRELEERTADFLPIGLVPHHIDRATFDLNRMARPPRRIT